MKLPKTAVTILSGLDTKHEKELLLLRKVQGGGKARKIADSSVCVLLQKLGLTKTLDAWRAFAND